MAKGRGWVSRRVGGAARRGEAGHRSAEMLVLVTAVGSGWRGVAVGWTVWRVFVLDAPAAAEVIAVAEAAVALVLAGAVLLRQRRRRADHPRPPPKCDAGEPRATATLLTVEAVRPPRPPSRRRGGRSRQSRGQHLTGRNPPPRCPQTGAKDLASMSRPFIGCSRTLTRTAEQQCWSEAAGMLPQIRS